MSKIIREILYRKWLLAIGLIMLLYMAIPIPKIQSPHSTIIESADGRLMGAKIANDGQWRFPEIDSLPQKMQACIRYFEDEYFYKHPGINPISMFRAFRQNVKAGRIVSGGSTITMQLVRIAMGNKPRTYAQKFLEILLATKYELIYSKEEIMQQYLSHAPFGGNVVGIEAASWRYYSRSPYQLSWAESATMAVLPNAPALIYPGKSQQLLLEKRNRLLRKLYDKRVIDSTDYELALMEPLPGKPHDLPRMAPHLLERYALSNEGGRLRSSLNMEYQQRVNQIIAHHHRVLVHNKIYNAAALVIDNRNKNVLAYVGNTQNTNAEHGSDVDIITAPRSTGSVLKPLLFSAMITDGVLLPNMLVADVPTQLQGYSPKNFTLSYDGAVPAKKALSRSLNVPAVRMLQDFGVDRFLEYLRQLDLSHINKSADYYGLSLILGGAEASLWDLTSTYSNMAGIVNSFSAQSGKYCPHGWEKAVFILTEKKQTTPSNRLNDEFKVFSASAIYSTFQALLEVNRPENQLGWEMFSSSRQVAWKTGTSFGYRDAWAIGVTPEYTVAVWVGNADGEGRPGLTGATAAAPVMFDIFDALPATTWFSPPYDDMIQVPICRESGFKLSQFCEHADTVWVSAQANKTGICPFHKIIHLDSTSMYQVNSNCYPQQYMVHKSWFVLPPSWEWYFRTRNPFYKKLPPLSPDCLGESQVQMMEFLYPSEAANMYVPRDMNGQLSEVVFQLVHREANVEVYWHLDNEFIGTTHHFHEMGIQPLPGLHRMTVIDEFGNSLTKQFTILERER